MERYKNIIIFLSGVIISTWFFGNVSAEELSPKKYSLTLEEVSQLALINNIDIQLAKYDTWISRTNKDVAESIYATIFNGEVGYNDDQSKKTSTIFGTKTVTNDYNIGLEKKLPTGTKVEVDLTNNRQNSNSSFTTSPTTHDSALGILVTQELGKNFLGIQDRGNVKITTLDIESTEYSSLDRIEQYLALVQKAYWNLVLASEAVKIQQEMIDQALRLFELQKEKLEDGLAEKPDVLASEANYKSQLNTMKLLQNSEKRRINALALLLNIPEKTFKIIPKDAFDDFIEEISMDQALQAAFNNRQDYKKVRNDIKTRDIKLSMKKNNLWPEVNLTASLKKNGLGDHFPDAVQQITEEDNPNFFAGLTVSIPLLNKEARAELKAAELEKAKELLNLKYIERKIFLEISDLVRDANVFYQIAQDQKEVADLQQQKLEEEEKRFNRGRSNTDTIIRFQEDAIRARDAAVVAQHRYQTAVVDLEQKSSVLLKKYWNERL